MNDNTKNKCIGVDITSEQLVACAVSKDGQILHYVSFENDGDDLPSDIVELIEKLLEDSGIKSDEISHIGVGSTECNLPCGINDSVQETLGIKCHLANNK